jgi:hypothetical protein
LCWNLPIAVCHLPNLCTKESFSICGLKNAPTVCWWNLPHVFRASWELFCICSFAYSRMAFLILKQTICAFLIDGFFENFQHELVRSISTTLFTIFGENYTFVGLNKPFCTKPYPSHNSAGGHLTQTLTNPTKPILR